jgi:hypothetical protein
MRATRRRSTPRDPGAGLLGIYGEIGDVAADGRLTKSGAVIHDRLSATSMQQSDHDRRLGCMLCRQHGHDTLLPGNPILAP